MKKQRKNFITSTDKWCKNVKIRAASALSKPHTAKFNLTLNLSLGIADRIGAQKQTGSKRAASRIQSQTHTYRQRHTHTQSAERRTTHVRECRRKVDIVWRESRWNCAQSISRVYFILSSGKPWLLDRIVYTRALTSTTRGRELEKYIHKYNDGGGRICDGAAVCVPVHEWGASGAFTHRFYSGVLQNSSSINITESSPENYYTMSMPRPWFALIPVEINKFKRTQLKNDSEIRASSGTDWRITMSFNWLLSMCQSQIQFRLFNGNFESNRNN